MKRLLLLTTVLLVPFAFAVSANGASSCRHHSGPWPMAAPGVHRCVTVSPSNSICVGRGTKLICPSVLARITKATTPN